MAFRFAFFQLRPSRLACLAAVCASFTAVAADSSNGPVRLAGVFSFSTNALAIIEDQTTKPPLALILGEGESNRRVSVIKIDPAQEKVEIHFAGEFRELVLDHAHASGATNFIHLDQAPLQPVLEIYQRLVSRTSIRSPLLTDVRLDLMAANVPDQAQMAKAIENALADKGILTRPDRDKFTIVAQANELQKLAPQLWDLALAVQKGLIQNGGGIATVDQQIPPGMLDFRGADLFQLESIYQDLCKRTLLRPSATALQPNVWLHTATSLSRAEAVYAFNLVLALSNVSIREFGDKFLLVYPTVQTNLARTVLETKLPEHKIADTTPVPAGAIDLWAVGLKELSAQYQKLAGEPVTLDADLPDVHFLLRNVTPLAPSDALHALDLLLAWHGLAATPQPDGKGLKIVRSNNQH